MNLDDLSASLAERTQKSTSHATLLKSKLGTLNETSHHRQNLLQSDKNNIELLIPSITAAANLQALKRAQKIAQREAQVHQQGNSNNNHNVSHPQRTAPSFRELLTLSQIARGKEIQRGARRRPTRKLDDKDEACNNDDSTPGHTQRSSIPAEPKTTTEKQNPFAQPENDGEGKLVDPEGKDSGITTESKKRAGHKQELKDSYIKLEEALNAIQMSSGENQATGRSPVLHKKRRVRNFTYYVRKQEASRTQSTPPKSYNTANIDPSSSPTSNSSSHPHISHQLLSFRYKLNENPPLQLIPANAMKYSWEFVNLSVFGSRVHEMRSLFLGHCSQALVCTLFWFTYCQLLQHDSEEESEALLDDSAWLWNRWRTMFMAALTMSKSSNLSDNPESDLQFYRDVEENAKDVDLLDLNTFGTYTERLSFSKVEERILMIYPFFLADTVYTLYCSLFALPPDNAKMPTVASSFTATVLALPFRDRLDGLMHSLLNGFRMSEVTLSVQRRKFMLGRKRDEYVTESCEIVVPNDEGTSQQSSKTRKYSFESKENTELGIVSTINNSSLNTGDHVPQDILLQFTSTGNWAVDELERRAEQRRRAEARKRETERDELKRRRQRTSILVLASHEESKTNEVNDHTPDAISQAPFTRELLQAEEERRSLRAKSVTVAFWNTNAMTPLMQRALKQKSPGNHTHSTHFMRSIYVPIDKSNSGRAQSKETRSAWEKEYSEVKRKLHPGSTHHTS